MLSLIVYWSPLYLAIISVIFCNSKNRFITDTIKYLTKLYCIVWLFSSLLIVFKAVPKPFHIMNSFGLNNTWIWFSGFILIYNLLKGSIDEYDLYVGTICSILFLTEYWEIPIHIMSVMSGGINQLLLTFMLSFPYIILIVPFLLISKRNGLNWKNVVVKLLAFSFIYSVIGVILIPMCPDRFEFKVGLTAHPIKYVMRIACFIFYYFIIYVEILKPSEKYKGTIDTIFNLLRKF